MYFNFVNLKKFNENTFVDFQYWQMLLNQLCYMGACQIVECYFVEKNVEFTNLQNGKFVEMKICRIFIKKYH